MKKTKQPELKAVDELEGEEPVERLKVNRHGADEEESLGSDDIDNLLREKKKQDDEVLDSLFTDERKNKYDDVEIEVRKALYESKTSQANLLRANKSAEVTKETRSEEIAKYKTLEDDWDGTIEEVKAGKSLIYLAVVILVIIIGAGIWALWNVSRNDQVAHKETLEKRKQDREALENLKADTAKQIKKVESVLTQFTAVLTADEKLEFLHDAENFKEQMLAYYQQPENIEPYPNLEIERVVEELIHEKVVWTVIASYGHRDDRKHEFFFFHEEPDGRYTLDWKAMTRTQDADWKKFVNEQSTEPIEIRVIVQPRIQDGHYNWGFKDDDYSAYRLILNDEQVFWGYVRNDNEELVKKMNDTVITMKAYQKVYPSLDLEMILKIRFLANTHELNKQCVEITEIVSPHWLDLREDEGNVENVEEIEDVDPTENP